MNLLAALLVLTVFHEDSISSSRITVRGADVDVVFTFATDDLKAIGEPTLDRVYDYITGRLTLSGCRPDRSSAVLVLPPAPAPRAPITLRVRFVSDAPVRNLRITCTAFREHAKNAKHIVDFAGGGTAILQGTVGEAEWTAPKSSLLSFVALGIEHILTGWDHLAFLLTLLLVAGRLGAVIRLVTAFTLAHSITLGLTALRLVSPPSAIVEGVIAASIVYVAFENIVRTEYRWRGVLVFAFGLVHGMGFGGVLLEMNLARPAVALLGFNVGVEMGQIAVVGIAFPVLAMLRRNETAYRVYVVRGLSAAAGCAGLVWLYERIAG